MNTTIYAQNPGAARKIACSESFEKLQSFMRFYRDSKGFTKYYKEEKEAIIKRGRDEWQSVLDLVNVNAFYYGQYLYKRILKLLYTLKKLVDNEEKMAYPMIFEWSEKYPKLIEAHQKLEKASSDEEVEIEFAEFFNELRIAVNKEYMDIVC